MKMGRKKIWKLEFNCTPPFPQPLSLQFGTWEYGYRSSQSTVDLVTVVSDRIARAFNRYWATLTVTMDIFKAFDRVQHSGFLHKFKSYGVSGEISDIWPYFFFSQ